MLPRRVRRLLWILAICVLGVLGLRTFVCDLYQITSSSMVPSLWPGEIVAVAYDGSRPERNETVVVEKGGEFVVKRAVGVGGDAGEHLLIDRSGDLLVEGERLPPDVHRERVLVFDQARHAISEHFARGGSTGDPWREHTSGVLELDASQLERGQEAGLLRYHPRLLDDHLDRSGNRVPGTHTVQDAAVEFELRPLDAAGLVRVGLVEEGDTFWFVIEPSAGRAQASLVRDDGKKLHTLAEVPLELAVGTWTRLSFSNIDNHLVATVGGVPVLRASYEYNTPHPADRLGNGLSMGERVKLGGEGCRLEVRDLRLWRDLHYTASGDHAVGTRLFLEPGKLFLLGDNSADSIDSREYGPVDESQVVGRPVLVVWPPAAIRWLR